MTQERTIQYGSLWPEGHFGREVAHGFAEAVGSGTNGRIRVEVTPPMPDEQLTKDVIEGRLAMTSGHAIQDYVPELALGYLPYLYRSYDDYRKIWSLGTPVSDAILGKFTQRKVPVVVLGYSVIGFRDMILRDRPIVAASDFKGLQVRFDGSSTSHDTFLAFGADPQYIEYHAVKAALAAGQVEAAANTSYNLIYMQWYEVTKHVSLTSHQILTNLEIVNQDFWRSLEAPDQALFRTSMSQACDSFAEKAKAQRDIAVQQLSTTYGLAVNEISDDTRKDLEAAVESMKHTFVEKYGLQDEYDQVVAAQADAR